MADRAAVDQLAQEFAVAAKVIENQLGNAGVVVVDTKLAGWGQAILDKIKTISNKPVTMIINTHSHPDHVGSNEAFPATVVLPHHQ